MSAHEVQKLIRRVRPNLGFYVGFTFPAGAVPRAAAFGFLLSSVTAVLRARGDSGPEPA